MALPEPDCIVNAQPMTVAHRVPPPQHSSSPVTQSSTNVTSATPSGLAMRMAEREWVRAAFRVTGSGAPR